MRFAFVFAHRSGGGARSALSPVLLTLLIGFAAFASTCFAVAPGAAVAAVTGNDSAQLSVTAPVKVDAVLDPASGEVSMPDVEVTNNGCAALLSSAAFSGAEGVSGVWSLSAGGQQVAQMGVDGIT